MDALEGVTILDLTRGVAGPLGVLLLAEHGADVIKVEPPGGDPGRDRPEQRVWNRSRRSITLDLKSPSGQERFRALRRGACRRGGRELRAGHDGGLRPRLRGPPRPRARGSSTSRCRRTRRPAVRPRRVPVGMRSCERDRGCNTSSPDGAKGRSSCAVQLPSLAASYLRADRDPRCALGARGDRTRPHASRRRCSRAPWPSPPCSGFTPSTAKPTVSA